MNNNEPPKEPNVASEPYSVKQDGDMYLVNGKDGSCWSEWRYRCNAENDANRLNAAHEAGASAAADEVGRLREALERIKSQCNQIREAPAFPMLTMNARMDSIKVIARAALATDASGAMKHKENGNGK